MFGGIESWSQFDPTDELLMLRLLKTFTLVLMTSVRTHSP